MVRLGWAFVRFSERANGISRQGIRLRTRIMGCLAHWGWKKSYILDEKCIYNDCDCDGYPKCSGRYRRLRPNRQEQIELVVNFDRASDSNASNSNSASLSTTNPTTILQPSMSESPPSELYGSCACERNQYTILIPHTSASHAQVFFDNSVANRK